MRTLSLLAVLVGFLAFSSCQRPIDYGRAPIGATGIFNCFNNEMVVTVSERPNEKLGYTVSRKRSKVGPSDPPLQKSSAWVIFPETADSVWIYDGHKDVTL